MTTGSSPLRDAPGPLRRGGSASVRSPVTGGNLVIFRTGDCADAVVALPCFHAIAREFPGAHRILLTDAGPAASAVKGLLEGADLVHETICYPSPAGPMWSLPAMVQTLRQLAPLALVCLAEQPAALSIYRDLLVFKAAGIPRILGAPWNAADGQCRTEVKTGELEYEAERLARVLGAEIPVDLCPPSWDLRLSPAEREAASRRLAALPRGVLPVALAPAAPPARDWGEARWATLIGLLHLRLSRVGLVLVGDAEAAERAARLKTLWPDPVVDLCGELTPREQAAVLERCGLLVCCAGGAMHLAASCAVTCIALFGSVDRAHQWHPYGGQHVVIHEPQGMRAIGVERVADAVVAAVDRLQAPCQSANLLRLTDRSAVSG